VNPEVDKAGHPRLKEIVGPLKPDLIVHIPGRMDSNLAVVEVKHISATNAAVLKDVRTLKVFLRKVRYRYAVHLVYGEGSNDSFTQFRRIHAQAFAGSLRRRVTLLWHRRPGERATEE